MILSCRAYSASEYSGPDFMSAELTDEFLATLEARQRLAAGLGRYGDAFEFDSICCHDFSPVWFREFDDEEGLLDRMLVSASIVVVERAPAIPDRVDGMPVICRTEMDYMQVWPDRFRFECSREGSEDGIRSETITFAEFYAALAAARMGDVNTAGSVNGTGIVRRGRAAALLEHHKRVLLHEGGPLVLDRDATVLLADLCHLLGHEGIDPENVFRVAVDEYRHESRPVNAGKDNA